MTHDLLMGAAVHYFRRHSSKWMTPRVKVYHLTRIACTRSRTPAGRPWAYPRLLPILWIRYPQIESALEEILPLVWNDLIAQASKEEMIALRNSTPRIDSVAMRPKSPKSITRMGSESYCARLANLSSIRLKPLTIGRSIADASIRQIPLLILLVTW